MLGVSAITGWFSAEGLLGVAILLFAAASLGTLLIARRLRGTERRLMEMSARAFTERRKLDIVTESAGAGLLLFDPELKLQWFNGCARSWLGLDLEALGKAWREDHAAGRAVFAAARDARPDAAPRTTECVLEEQSGRQRWIQINTTPVCDSNGTLTQIVQLLLDVTAHRQTRTQLLHAAKLATVGQLAGSIAHEVNNPVAIIAAKVRLVLADYKGVLPERVSVELTKVVEQANRLGALTHRLLAACRPSPGVKGRVKLEDVLARVLDLVGLRAKAAGVTTHARRECRGAQVLGNANEIEQVLLNLVTNALDAMSGGGELILDMGCGPPLDAQSPVSIFLRVRDTGPGIPPELHSRIFEPFFTTKTEGHGTGLGLAISLGIAQDHGGTIDVESEEGRGATFTLRLPPLSPLPCGWSPGQVAPDRHLVTAERVEA